MLSWPLLAAGACIIMCNYHSYINKVDKSRHNPSVNAIFLYPGLKNSYLQHIKESHDIYFKVLFENMACHFGPLPLKGRNLLGPKYLAPVLKNREALFQIKSVNAECESQPLEGAESVTPTVKQEPQLFSENLQVKVLSDSVSITWDNSKSDGGSPVVNYIKKESWKCSLAHVDRVDSLKPAFLTSKAKEHLEGSIYVPRVFDESSTDVKPTIDLQCTCCKAPDKTQIWLAIAFTIFLEPPLPFYLFID